MVVIANDTIYHRDAILDLAITLEWAHGARVALDSHPAPKKLPAGSRS